MYNALASFGCSGELWGLRMNRGVLLVLLVLLLLLLQQAQALPFVEGLGTSITAAAVGGTHQGAQNAVYAHLGEGAAVKGSIQGPDYEHGQPFSNYSNSRQLQWASAGPLGRRRRSPNDVTAVAVAALLGVVVLLLSCGVSILRSAKATQAWATERHLASGVGKGLCEQTTTAKEGAHEEGTAEVAAGGRGEVAAAEGRGGQEVSISAPGSSSVNPVAVPLIRTVSVSEREGAGERKRSAGRDLGELAVPFLKRAASSECSGTTAGGAVAAEAATTPEIEEEGVSSRRTGGSETIPTPAGVSSSLDPMAVPFVPRGFVSEGDGAGEKHRTAGRGRKAPASTSLEPVAPPAQSAEAPEGHATREATAAEAKAAAGVATSGVKKKVPRPPLLWGVGADNVIGQYPSVGTYLYRIQQLGSYCRLHLEFLPRGQARQTAQLLVRYGVLEIGALTPYCADKEEYIRQRAIDAFCRLAMAFGARLQKHLAAASSFDNLMHALYLLKARRSFPSCGVQGRPHANKHVLPAAGAALRQMATAVNMLLQSVESIPSAAPSPVGATQTAVMAAVIEERVLQMLSESLAAQSLQCLQIQCPPGAIVSHADVILSQARYGPGFGWAKAAFVNLAAAQAAAGARAATAKENALEQELRVRARATPDAEADFPGAEGAHSLKVSAAPDSLHAAASATTKGPEAAAGGRESKTKSKRKGERDRKLSGSARIRPPRPPLPSFPMPHHAFLSPHYGRGSLPSTARSSPNLQPHLVGQLEQGEPWGLLPQHQALLLGRRWARSQYPDHGVTGEPSTQPQQHGLEWDIYSQPPYEPIRVPPPQQQALGQPLGPVAQPTQPAEPLVAPFQQQAQQYPWVPSPPQQGPGEYFGPSFQPQEQAELWGASSQQHDREDPWLPSLSQHFSEEPRGPPTPEQEPEPWMYFTRLLDDAGEGPSWVSSGVFGPAADNAPLLTPGSSPAKLDPLGQGAAIGTHNEYGGGRTGLLQGFGFTTPLPSVESREATGGGAHSPQQQQEHWPEVASGLFRGTDYTVPLTSQGEPKQPDAPLQQQQQQQQQHPQVLSGAVWRLEGIPETIRERALGEAYLGMRSSMARSRASGAETPQTLPRSLAAGSRSAEDVERAADPKPKTPSKQK